MDEQGYDGVDYMDQDRAEVSLAQDFDRGFVQMECDQKDKGCTYGLPHYHCQICGNQVNSDEKRRDYHPCCSLGCIKTYNQ